MRFQDKLETKSDAPLSHSMWWHPPSLRCIRTHTPIPSRSVITSRLPSYPGGRLRRLTSHRGTDFEPPPFPRSSSPLHTSFKPHPVRATLRSTLNSAMLARENQS